MEKPFYIQPLDKQKDKKEPSFIAKIPFSMYVVASKGGGKSTTIIQLLRNPLKGKFNRIFWISPTAHLDEKIQSLKEERNLLAKNDKLIALLKRMRKRKNIMGDEIDIDFKTQMENSDFKSKLDIPFLQELIDEQKYIISEFGKSFADNILIVFDDSVLDDILKDKKFIEILFQSRHYKLSFIIISQSYKALAKKVRINTSQLLLYETGNSKELREIYEENNNGISFDKFMTFYKEAIKIPYNFLNINNDNFLNRRFISGFNKFLQD